MLAFAPQRAPIRHADWSAALDQQRRLQGTGNPSRPTGTRRCTKATFHLASMDCEG